MDSFLTLTVIFILLVFSSVGFNFYLRPFLLKEGGECTSTPVKSAWFNNSLTLNGVKTHTHTQTGSRFFRKEQAEFLN